ncbi:MAG: glycosyl transferase family 2 [Acidimicrobiales bacterium]|nr:MAG: glycosyl transferase family 2 [Acidimicrobiales bacterium]
MVVPTRDSMRTIRRCLESIRSQDYPAIELIVVDNGSTDGTLQTAERYADLVISAGPERSVQRNIGIEKSTGEYILWIDSDMILDPDCVSKAVEAIERDGAEAVFIREITVGEGYWTHCRALERLCYLGEPLIESPRLVRKRFFEESGGFVHDVAGQEDAELRMRLLRSGLPLTRSDGEIKHDEGRITLRGVVAKRVYYGRSIPNYARWQPGAVREQGIATLRALWRGRGILARDPLHAPGVLVLRAVEAVAYAWGARKARKASHQG